MKKINKSLEWVYCTVFPDASTHVRSEIRFGLFVAVLLGLALSMTAFLLSSTAGL